MAEYKVGDKVRILDVEKIAEGDKYWNNGDITTVAKVWKNGCVQLERTIGNTKYNNCGLFLNEIQYIELVNTSDEMVKILDKINSLEKRVEELEIKISTTNIYFEIESKLDSKELASKIIEVLKKKYEQEKVDNNQLRKQVINEAKGLLKAHENDKQIKYLVNKDKQLITCVVIDEDSGKVVSQGIAKTTTRINEVYNEYIGKAIALCKALNVNADKYKNAPLPDKIIEGHIIKNKELPDFIYTVIKRIDELTMDVKSHTNHTIYYGYSFNNKAEDYFLIIEDTDVEY